MCVVFALIDRRVEDLEIDGRGDIMRVLKKMISPRFSWFFSLFYDQLPKRVRDFGFAGLSLKNIGALNG